MNPRSSDRKACFSMFRVDSVSYAPKCMTTRLARKLSTVSSAFSTFAHGVCDSFKERCRGDRPVSGSLQQKQISYVICSLNSGLVSGTMITPQPPHTPRLHRDPSFVIYGCGQNHRRKERRQRGVEQSQNRVQTELSHSGNGVQEMHTRSQFSQGKKCI